MAGPPGFTSTLQKDTLQTGNLGGASHTLRSYTQKQGRAWFSCPWRSCSKHLLSSGGEEPQSWDRDSVKACVSILQLQPSRFFLRLHLQWPLHSAVGSLWAPVCEPHAGSQVLPALIPANSNINHCSLLSLLLSPETKCTAVGKEVRQQEGLSSCQKWR